MANPAYPDTPWWSSLLAVLITAIVSVLGTLYAMRPSAPGAPVTATVGSLFTDTLTYIPHIMLLFGILADMFTYQGVYSIPSLIGLLSIPLNFLMGYFWTGMSDVFVKLKNLFAEKGGVSTISNPRATSGRSTIVSSQTTGSQSMAGGGKFFNDYDGCDVQGFKWAHSPFAPQTLVVTATIFSYYIFDLIQNRGWTNATAAIVMFFVLFSGQIMTIGDCSVDSEEPGRYLKAFVAFVEGLLFGGVGYSVVQSYFPGRLPSTSVSPFPKKTPEDLTPSASGGFKDSDGNPYVCLPNGQCYPDLSTAASRTAFANIAAANLGTGAPAVPEDCAAKPSTPSE